MKELLAAVMPDLETVPDRHLRSPSTAICRSIFLVSLGVRGRLFLVVRVLRPHICVRPFLFRSLHAGLFLVRRLLYCIAGSSIDSRREVQVCGESLR